MKREEYHIETPYGPRHVFTRMEVLIYSDSPYAVSSCNFELRYLKARRSDVFKAAIKRVRDGIDATKPCDNYGWGDIDPFTWVNIPESEIKVAIIKAEREFGYMSSVRDGGKYVHYKELVRKEITLDRLKKILTLPKKYFALDRKKNSDRHDLK